MGAFLATWLMLQPCETFGPPAALGTCCWMDAGPVWGVMIWRFKGFSNDGYGYAESAQWYQCTDPNKAGPVPLDY